MKMVSKSLISAGLLSVATSVILSGCNMANSGDEASEPTNLATPTADLTIVSSSRSANDQEQYFENTTLRVDAAAIGSMGSTVSCVTTFDYKASANTDFVTKETFNSCEAYDFNLYSGSGIYRFKLTATDANTLVAEDQLFAIAIADDGSDIYQESDPMALVEVIGSSKEPNSSGYYFEDTTVTVSTEAAGSLGSDITCSIDLGYNDGTAAEFTVLQTVTGCGVKDFNLYSGVGTYQMKLTATDTNTKVAEDQKFVITIPTELADTVYLNADFETTVSTDDGSLFDVFLDARSSSEGTGGDIATYSWEVFLKEEDEITETAVETVSDVASPTTTVVVDRDGVYVARLTIVDASEAKAITEKMFMVSGTGATLIADFTVTIPANAPVNIEVDASASTVDAGIDHYEWEVFSTMGDSTPTYQLTVESATTVLPIAVTGTYLVRLTVIDIDGNEHEITRIISVP
ncbi:MAG: hypothetical protein U9R28_10175 [Pseudomonadota bacterium]|nr:hypothetical protein [Pseudomonadota bacterium]